MFEWFFKKELKPTFQCHSLSYGWCGSARVMHPHGEAAEVLVTIDNPYYQQIAVEENKAYGAHRQMYYSAELELMGEMSVLIVGYDEGTRRFEIRYARKRDVPGFEV